VLHGAYMNIPAMGAIIPALARTHREELAKTESPVLLRLLIRAPAARCAAT
jgi:hypothetical protein